MHRGAKLRLAAYALLCAVVFLTGCAPAFTRAPAANSAGSAPFLPPTAAVQPTSSPPAETGVTAATSTITCQDQLKFIADLTIPDGTTVAPESTLDKRWEVENSGNCNWDEHYRVRLVAGPELSAQKEQTLYPARSGTHAVIRFIFKAPLEPGAYRSAWQAYNPSGEPFGDPFFIDIIVQ
jgi:hypothetical protein